MEQHTLEKRWQALSLEVISGMAEWRVQHPKATLKEIEAALDERLGWNACGRRCWKKPPC